MVADKFSGFYNLLNKVDGHHTISPMKRWFARKFQSLIVEYQPDLLVSTWPVGSKYIGAYKKRTKDTIPYITCITDISAHSEWISDETTAYIVSDDVSKRELEKKGIDAGRLFVGGIPVRQDFKVSDAVIENNKSKSDGVREVLMMGGGLGLIPGADDMLTYMEKLPKVHVTVITGNNEKLRKSLEGKYKNTDVMGYTKNVAEYMKKADFIISKAGGITLFESIYTETPMMVVYPFLEQEKRMLSTLKL